MSIKNMWISFQKEQYYNKQNVYKEDKNDEEFMDMLEYLRENGLASKDEVFDGLDLECFDIALILWINIIIQLNQLLLKKLKLALSTMKKGLIQPMILWIISQDNLSIVFPELGLGRVKQSKNRLKLPARSK